MWPNSDSSQIKIEQNHTDPGAAAWHELNVLRNEYTVLINQIPELNVA